MGGAVHTPEEPKSHYLSSRNRRGSGIPRNKKNVVGRTRARSCKGRLEREKVKNVKVKK